MAVAGKEVNLRLERGKKVRDLSRDNKGCMGELCFLKTHMFLEITQEE